MSNARRLARVLVAASAIVATACSTSKSATPSTKSNEPAQKTVAGAPLIGPMKPVVSVKELMRYTIDPLADNIFDAVTWDISKKGVVHVEPKTDDDWEKVRIGAITLAEGIYLLKVPRPFTPPGDVNNSTGPNPPELSRWSSWVSICVQPTRRKLTNGLACRRIRKWCGCTGSTTWRRRRHLVRIHRRE